MAVCRLVTGIADTTHISLLLRGLLLYNPPLDPPHRLSSTDLHDGNDVGHGGLTSTSVYVGSDSSDDGYSSTSLSDYPVFTFLNLTDNRLESLLIRTTFVCKCYRHPVIDGISVQHLGVIRDLAKVCCYSG